MPMDDIELRRATIGMIALVCRESRNGEAAFETALANESLKVLSDAAGSVKVSISTGARSRSDQDIHSMVQDAVSQAAHTVEEHYARAYGSAIIAFVEFYDLVRQAAPDLDLDALIETLALRAAADPPGDGT